MRPKDDIGRSINQRINNIAKKLNVFHQNVMTDFLLEKLLTRIISSKELHDKVIFKGGYVCLKIYGSDRYTLDLDAILQKGDIRKTISSIKDLATKNLDDGVWFIFEDEVDLLTQGEYGGIRLVFRAGVGTPLVDIKRAQIINFDLGYGDPVTPAPIEKNIRSILGNNDISWLVYPVETTIAEKLNALITRRDFNSRSKDIYDLYFLLPKSDRGILKEAIKRTFDHRGDKIPKSFSKVLAEIDTAILSRGWNQAVKWLKNPIAFETAFDGVIKYCRDLLDG
jgi:predicted nucleotidyltransferase component of viral defense system